MLEQLSFPLFIISLLVLVVVLVVLLLLCWIVKNNRDRDFTELQLLSGQPPRRLTITTKSDNARQLLDHLLNRVFLLEEAAPESGGEATEQLEPELAEQNGSDAAATQTPPTSQDLPPQQSDTSQHSSTTCQETSNCA